MLNRYKTIKILNKLSDSHKKKQTQSGLEKLHGTHYSISRWKQWGGEAKQLFFYGHYQHIIRHQKHFKFPATAANSRCPKLQTTCMYRSLCEVPWTFIILSIFALRTRGIWFGRFGMGTFGFFAFGLSETFKHANNWSTSSGTILFVWLASHSIPRFWVVPTRVLNWSQ